MKFIALMLAIVLGYLVQTDKKEFIAGIRGYFEKYQRWSRNQFQSPELSNGWGGLAMFALVPSVILGLIIHFISNQFLIFMLILHIAVIMICLIPVDPELITEDKEQESIIAEFNILNIVSMIFWYFILGPVGILSVKLLIQSRDIETLSEESNLALSYINWIPARLLMLSYALVGNFHGVFSETGPDTLHWGKDSVELTEQAAKSALWPHFEELEQQQALVQTAALYRRTIICWLAVIALISITF